MTSHSEKHIHQGRNIKRFREMLGIKQEAIAISLGDDWTQKKVSLLEAKEMVEPALLKRVAEIFQVPVAALENMDDEGAINIIANTFNEGSSAFNDNDTTGYDSSTINHNTGNDNSTFNINVGEEWLKALDENKKLYERLLQSEREKVEMLERLLKEKR